MKKNYWLVACLSLGLIVACGGDSKKDSSDNHQASVEAVNTEKPFSDNEQSAKMVFTIASHEYDISIYRYPNEKLPLVIDEMDQKYYDNSVDISIRRDGDTLTTKTISKDVFKDLLPAQEYKSGMLLGMNCDTARCEPSRLCFTAQVGQAGEGPAFLVYILTNDGAMSVARDYLQEDMSYHQ